jgi:hypothetical protein
MGILSSTHFMSEPLLTALDMYTRSESIMIRILTKIVVKVGNHKFHFPGI